MMRRLLLATQLLWTAVSIALAKENLRVLAFRAVEETSRYLPNFAIAATASFANCQNFSVAGLRRPLRAAMPKEIGFGSGVSRSSFTRLPKL